MAATTAGTKTVTKTLAPHLTATTLTTLLATPIENLTVAQVQQLIDALRRVQGGRTPGNLVGSLLS